MKISYVLKNANDNCHVISFDMALEIFVAISNKYDFIFDGSVSLLYGKPTYDVTDDVLYELRKEISKSQK